MNRALTKQIALFLFLILGSLLLLQFVWRLGATPDPNRGLSADKINLALRRTAHYLLADSTVRIAPVEQIAANVWFVRLEHTFDYDRLPALLQESFDIHGVQGNYDVAVLRCLDGQIQLGYNFFDVSQQQNVACVGREMETGCYNLQVTFSTSDQPGTGIPQTSWLLGGGCIIALLGLGWRWRKSNRALPPANLSETQEFLHFGNTRLDTKNQLMYCGTTQHQLTYREAKLLDLFASHPNELLTRAFILENVWADEGILVGRSVDVFVSRLRKMLRNDPSVRLMAVHGVGYRLELD